MATPRWIDPQGRRWGATDEEASRPLPGDEYVRQPKLQTTRAVAVASPAAGVWPWLVQLGQGRGGLYSYDRLENLVGCRMHSVDRIVPELQRLAVGELVKAHPKMGWMVARVEPPVALVLRAADIASGTLASIDAPPHWDFSWAFVLADAPGGCRLLARERYDYRGRGAAAAVNLTVAVSFLMTQRMLRGIKARAERGGGAR
jgi:hypothetical protein